MQITNKAELIEHTIARVVNNAPVSEVLRVYAESLRIHVENFPDEELIKSLQNAGYQDLLDEYVTTGEEPSPAE